MCMALFARGKKGRMFTMQVHSPMHFMCLCNNFSRDYLLWKLVIFQLFVTSYSCFGHWSSRSQSQLSKKLTWLVNTPMHDGNISKYHLISCSNFLQCRFDRLKWWLNEQSVGLLRQGSQVQFPSVQTNLILLFYISFIVTLMDHFHS